MWISWAGITVGEEFIPFDSESPGSFASVLQEAAGRIALGAGGYINLYLDTSDVVFAPDELIGRYGARSILAAANFEPTGGERVVTSRNTDGLVSIWAADDTAAGLVENALDGYEVEVYSPLQLCVEYINDSKKLKYPLTVVYLSGHNIYFVRLDRYGVLRRAAAYPYEGIADVVYTFGTMDADEKVRKMRYVFLGRITGSDKKILEQNFTKCKCGS